MVLKRYWKVENVVEVRRCWRVEFGTAPPRVTITRIGDMFEVDGMVQDVNVRNFLDHTFNQRWIGRLPLGNFNEHGVCHKTTKTGRTERSG